MAKSASKNFYRFSLKIFGRALPKKRVQNFSTIIFGRALAEKRVRKNRQISLESFGRALCKNRAQNFGKRRQNTAFRFQMKLTKKYAQGRIRSQNLLLA